MSGTLQLFCGSSTQLIRLCKLHHLNLSYCERLTDTSLEWLSGSSISSLDISGCNIQDQVSFECLFLQLHISWRRDNWLLWRTICNLIVVFSGAGCCRGSSPEEVSSCWVCLHHRHWHRGKNLATISTHGQMWYFYRSVYNFNPCLLSFPN